MARENLVLVSTFKRSCDPINRDFGKHIVRNQILLFYCLLCSFSRLSQRLFIHFMCIYTSLAIQKRRRICELVWAQVYYIRPSSCMYRQTNKNNNLYWYTHKLWIFFLIFLLHWYAFWMKKKNRKFFDFILCNSFLLSLIIEWVNKLFHS